MARRQRRVLLGTATALFALIAVPVLLYAQGYRFSSGFTLTKTGGLYVSAGAAEARIYLNNRLRKETGLLQRGLFVQNLAPATYSVLVSKEEFWPWQKTLQVQEQHVAEAKAFLVPREPQGIVLVNGNYEAFFASPNGKTVLLIENANSRKKAVFYHPAANRFLNEADAATTRALAYQSELRLLDWQDSIVRLAHEKGLVQASVQETVVEARVTGRAPAATSTRQEYWTYHDRERIWLDQAANAIWVEWLDSTSTLPYYLQAPRELVFQSSFPIRAIHFFPQRRDVIVMAVSNGIFALELDNRGDGRMLQPVYKGNAPLFARIGNEMALYVLDNGSLMRIALTL